MSKVMELGELTDEEYEVYQQAKCKWLADNCLYKRRPRDEAAKETIAHQYALHHVKTEYRRATKYKTLNRGWNDE